MMLKMQIVSSHAQRGHIWQHSVGETPLNSLSQLGCDSRGPATEKGWQREMQTLVEVTKATAALVSSPLYGDLGLDQGAKGSLSLCLGFRSSVSHLSRL